MQGAYIHQPRAGQYLTHAHSDITQAVAATDSRFVLIGANQRDKAVGLMNGVKPRLNTPYCRGDCKAVYQAPAPHNTCESCWLGTAQQFYHNMPGEGGSRVTSKSKQEANTHTNPWPGHYLMHAHSHIMRAVAAMNSSFVLTGAHQHGTGVGQ